MKKYVFKQKTKFGPVYMHKWRVGVCWNVSLFFSLLQHEISQQGVIMNKQKKRGEDFERERGKKTLKSDDIS